jgi:hypothetical protein
MRVLVHDIRYGLRTLIRTPVFTVTAVLVLARSVANDLSRYDRYDGSVEVD